MAFKKTCFECGAKEDKLYEGICENCFKEQFPPIQEIKPITLKFCNSTKKISYNSFYYKQEEIKKMLPEIIKKRLILNKAYKLNELLIENFQIKGHTVSFDVEVDCDLIA